MNAIASILQDDIRNLQRRFDGDGDCCVLTITWDDTRGEHQFLELKHDEALAVSRALWCRRSEAERLAYLKQIIREHRT